MSKVKMLLRAVGKYTVGYVACHWKEFLTEDTMGSDPIVKKSLFIFGMPSGVGARTA